MVTTLGQTMLVVLCFMKMSLTKSPFVESSKFLFTIYYLTEAANVFYSFGQIVDTVKVAENH